MSDKRLYYLGVWIFGLLGFVGIWLYALETWGFLLGLIFGWIPAAIGALVIGFGWPLWVFLALVAYLGYKS